MTLENRVTGKNPHKKPTNIETMTLPHYVIEDAWFDNDLPVQRIGHEPDVSSLGVTLEDFELVQLSGAMRDSTLICERVAWPYDALTGTQKQALSLKVTHPDILGKYENEVVVHLNSHYQIELYIQFMAVDPGQRGTGLATLMFWRIARAANLLGIDRIALEAIGGRTTGYMDDGTRWTGYYFWPSVGFDGQIGADDRMFFEVSFPYHPRDIKHVSRVRDVFERADGPAFWKLCGGNVRLCEFRTEESSLEMTILRQKVEKIVASYGEQP
jgi:hypothetical protein